MITTLILAAITASEVWGTWKALKNHLPRVCLSRQRLSASS